MYEQNQMISFVKCILDSLLMKRLECTFSAGFFLKVACEYVRRPKAGRIGVRGRVFEPARLVYLVVVEVSTVGVSSAGSLASVHAASRGGHHPLPHRAGVHVESLSFQHLVARCARHSCNSRNKTRTLRR